MRPFNIKWWYRWCMTDALLMYGSSDGLVTSIWVVTWPSCYIKYWHYWYMSRRQSCGHVIKSNDLVTAWLMYAWCTVYKWLIWQRVILHKEVTLMTNCPYVVTSFKDGSATLQKAVGMFHGVTDSRRTLILNCNGIVWWPINWLWILFKKDVLQDLTNEPCCMK